MRSLRSRLRETRLAVTLAMQPLAKRRRAFAMSTEGVRTGTPTLPGGGRRLPGGGGPARADAPGALAVVARRVGVGLEDAELAPPLGGDGARGHVGDAAVGEAGARIRDVDRGGEDRPPHRLD